MARLLRLLASVLQTARLEVPALFCLQRQARGLAAAAEQHNYFRIIADSLYIKILGNGQALDACQGESHK